MVFCVLHCIYSTHGFLLFYFSMEQWRCQGKPQGCSGNRILGAPVLLPCGHTLNSNSVLPCKPRGCSPSPTAGSWQFSASTMAAPCSWKCNSQHPGVGGEILKQTQAKKGQEGISPFRGSPWEPVCFWTFQRFFFFSSCVIKMLQHAKVNKTNTINWVKDLFLMISFLSPDSAWKPTDE